MWHRTIDCLGQAVSITSPLPELAPLLTAVLRTYATTTQPADLTYQLEHLDQPCVIRNGEIVRCEDETIDLVPAFEVDLYQHVIAAVRGLVLHAGAVVGASGETLVFTGRSGGGKSTLVRALLARGFRYLSEECVALFAEQRCRGLARALHVEDPSIEPPTDFVCDPYLLRGRPLIQLRLFHPPERMLWRGDARTRAVVAIDHSPDAPDSVERLTGGAALSALWPTVFRPDAEAIDFTTAALDGVAAFRMVTSSSDRALDRALDLARELGVHPEG